VCLTADTQGHMSYVLCCACPWAPQKGGKYMWEMHVCFQSYLTKSVLFYFIIFKEEHDCGRYHAHI
jgi:hypothetical protein